MSDREIKIFQIQDQVLLRKLQDLNAKMETLQKENQSLLEEVNILKDDLKNIWGQIGNMDNVLNQMYHQSSCGCR